MARPKSRKELSLFPKPKNGGAFKSHPSSPKGKPPFTTDLQYLQEELSWIEARARRIELKHKLATIESGDHEDESYDLHEDPIQILQEKMLGFKEKEEDKRGSIDARLAEQRLGHPQLAIDRLCDLYDLDDFERTLLLLAMAPCFSRKFDNIYGKLEQDGYYGSGLSVELAFNFCELDFSERIIRRSHFAPQAPLLAHDLLSVELNRRYSTPRDLLSASIQISNRTFGFLLGDNTIDDDFLEFSSVEEPKVSIEQVVLEPESKRRILSVVENHDRYLQCRKEWGFDDIIRYGRGILMLFYGKPGTGKTMMAHSIANRMKKRILNVDIPTFLQNYEADRYLPRLFREARLQDALLFFDECEVLFGSRHNGNALMTLLLTELERFEGVAILATNLPESLDPALDRRILVKVEFPEPDRQARHEIWKKHLPDNAPIHKDVDLKKLADRFQMTGGYIKNAVLMAVASALHDNVDEPSITMEHLENAAQEQLTSPDSSDDPYLDFPKVRLTQVVLPDNTRQQLEDLISIIRNQRIATNRWKIGQQLTYGRGTYILLSGPEGCGKTLCAEAISCELNRPLLIEAIPTTVSDKTGETERHLETIFRKAKQTNAIILFDDVDALFAQTETKARSIAAKLLVHWMERHSDIVLLTTRHADRLDVSLTGKVHHHIQLHTPTHALRQQLWELYISDAVPTDESVKIKELSAYPLNGRQIKEVTLQSAYKAILQQGHVTGALLNETLNQLNPEHAK
ncbi:MAG: hypothetical protein CL920_10405 [Deltaproteobacteria bacterium]|nr:hypothetical protein [Deltaproteobacteria bacterium]MBU49096.1 hypothetical protein [Deltaproteobacteria bacterium]|tara:strand:- start:3130 stop:5361 length:2232 start_codon:yes stop_codon:yes gene_type:complete